MCLREREGEREQRVRARGRCARALWLKCPTTKMVFEVSWIVGGRKICFGASV